MIGGKHVTTKNMICNFLSFGQRGMKEILKYYHLVVLTNILMDVAIEGTFEFCKSLQLSLELKRTSTG